MANHILTQERLKELLHYNPETGVFTRACNKAYTKKGDVAGYSDRKGYVIIGLDRKQFKAHRLAWLYVYGYLPNSEIDHINRVKNDNRIVNLRIACGYENTQNVASPRVNNTTGFLGVHWHKEKQKFVASIAAYGKRMHLGQYDTAEEASVAYIAAKRQLHPYSTL